MAERCDAYLGNRGSHNPRGLLGVACHRRPTLPGPYCLTAWVAIVSATRAYCATGRCVRVADALLPYSTMPCHAIHPTANAIHARVDLTTTTATTAATVPGHALDHRNGRQREAS